MGKFPKHPHSQFSHLFFPEDDSIRQKVSAEHSFGGVVAKGRVQFRDRNAGHGSGMKQGCEHWKRELKWSADDIKSGITESSELPCP